MNVSTDSLIKEKSRKSYRVVVVPEVCLLDNILMPFHFFHCRDSIRHLLTLITFIVSRLLNDGDFKAYLRNKTIVKCV